MKTHGRVLGLIGQACIHLLLVLMIVVTTKVHAANNDCAATGTPILPSTVNLAGIDVPRDLKVGEAIPGASASITWSFSCKPTGITGGRHWDLYLYSGTAKAVPGLTNVYQSVEQPLPGVGFRVLDQEGNALFMGAQDGDSHVIFMGDAPAGQTSFSWKGRFELVKIASEVGAGTKNLYMRAAVLGQVYGNETGAKSSFTISYTVREPALTTCAVTSKDQVVILPIVSQQAFGVGHVGAGKTPFDIKLQCEKGARLYMVMTDANFPGSANNLLFPQGGENGVAAVRVDRRDGGRVAFAPESALAGAANQWLVGDTPEGILSIPFTAEYQLNSSDPKAAFPIGAVKVAATFTLSYQ